MQTMQMLLQQADITESGVGHWPLGRQRPARSAGSVPRETVVIARRRAAQSTDSSGARHTPSSAVRCCSSRSSCGRVPCAQSRATQRGCRASGRAGAWPPALPGCSLAAWAAAAAQCASARCWAASMRVSACRAEYDLSF